VAAWTAFLNGVPWPRNPDSVFVSALPVLYIQRGVATEIFIQYLRGEPQLIISFRRAWSPWVARRSSGRERTR